MKDGVALLRGSTASTSGQTACRRGGCSGQMRDAWHAPLKDAGAVMLSIRVRPELPVLDVSVRATRARMNDSLSADGSRLMDLLR